MTLRVPDVGEEADLEKITSVDYDLRLFTNDVEDGLDESQINALVAADFTEATFTGYSAETLSSGDWTVTTGDPTEAANLQKIFTSSADQTSEIVLGYYVTEPGDGGELRWYEYFAGPVAVEFDGDEIRVTVERTHQDTVDAS